MSGSRGVCQYARVLVSESGGYADRISECADGVPTPRRTLTCITQLA